jgi:hypothetical protein
MIGENTIEPRMNTDFHTDATTYSAIGTGRLYNVIH